MKRIYLFLFLGFTFILELILTIVFLTNTHEIQNDTVKLNELTQEIEKNFDDTSKYPSIYSYVVIDTKGKVLYRTEDGLSESLNQAYQNSDTIIDIIVNDTIVGKIIVKNRFNEAVKKQESSLLISIAVISFIQLFSILLYYLYLYKSILQPFKKMRGFAERVASGNLDIPLEMDKGNTFGAFTESFDIMRSELKKAKLAEAEAEKSKRELVARLSHDIKTPVASIKSVAELGEAVAVDEKNKGRYNQITQKADQINTLVNNLFTITIEELDELSINPTEIPSYVVAELINNADYLNKGNKITLQECNVFFDRLRLQQVFDNIYANSYKYANTKIEASTSVQQEYLVVSIRDFGDTIQDEDIPLLLEKYKRGSNTRDKDGAGLGLYISSKFMEAMNGKLEIYNDKPGFRVLVYLRII